MHTHIHRNTCVLTWVALCENIELNASCLDKDTTQDRSKKSGQVRQAGTTLSLVQIYCLISHNALPSLQAPVLSSELFLSSAFSGLFYTALRAPGSLPQASHEHQCVLLTCHFFLDPPAIFSNSGRHGLTLCQPDHKQTSHRAGEGHSMCGNLPTESRPARPVQGSVLECPIKLCLDPTPSPGGWGGGEMKGL